MQIYADKDIREPGAIRFSASIPELMRLPLNVRVLFLLKNRQYNRKDGDQMAIIRNHTNHGYTTLSNYHLRDKRISLKAKGLLSLMLSLPDDWEYSIKGLASIVKEGTETIETTVKELKAFGYIEVAKVRNPENGLFEYVYDVYETPEKIKYPEGEFPPLDAPPLDAPPMETPPLIINKDKQNTEEQNTEIIKEKSRKKEKSTKITALEALEGFKEEFNLSEELTEALKDFIEMRKEIKDPITVNGLKRAINTLFKLSADPGEQLEIINQSIIAGYKGLFPLKPYQRQGGYQQPNRYDRPAEPEEEDALTRVRKRLEAEEAARKEEEARQNEYD